MGRFMLTVCALGCKQAMIAKQGGVLSAEVSVLLQPHRCASRVGLRAVVGGFVLTYQALAGVSLH